MSAQLLQVNFRFDVPREEYEAMLAPLADRYAAIPGCLWKIWLMNEEAGEAGGIYLFADEASIEAFNESSLVTAMLMNPALSGFQIKQFSVLEDMSRLTRGPIEMALFR